MMSSNDRLRECSKHGGRRDSGFAVIVAFDFYDGPERGLALYPSGDGVRFSSLGDSKSRLFRAFELIPIEGSWWPAVEVLQEADHSHSAHRLLWPEKSSEAVTHLESDVLAAPATGFYIAVGSPYLEEIYLSSVTEEQLDTVRQLGCSPAGFALAHRIVKAPAANM
jgi:hypothetical protein